MMSRTSPQTYPALLFLACLIPVLHARGQTLYEPIHHPLPIERLNDPVLLTEDLDGDGDLDLIHRSHASRNNGPAGFDSLRWNPGTSYTSLFAAEVTGDGVLDFFTVNSGQVTCHRSGPGTSWSPSSCFQGSSVPYLDFLDIDADGDLDAFLGGTRYELHRNDGSGNFVVDPLALPALPVTNFRTYDSAFGDVNGDGNLDLVLLGSLGTVPPSSQEMILTGNGTARFQLLWQLPSRRITIRGSHLVDLEGDGDLDLLRGNEEAFRNDGSGNFQLDPSVFPASLPGGRLLTGDFDGDGDLDGISFSDGVFFQATTFLRNDGTGTLMLDRTLADTRFNLLTGDLDDDGDLDLFLGSCLQPWCEEILLNDGAARFGSYGIPSDPRPQARGAAFADFDLDGDMDFIETDPSPSGSSAPYQLRFYQNDGTGRFQLDEQSFPQTGDLHQEATAADVNGDGLPDAIVGAASGRIDIFFASLVQGRVRFLASQAPLQLGTEITVLQCADIDGDADLDLFVGCGNRGVFGTRAANRLWVNDGSGAFTDASARLPASVESTTGAVLMDVDGDGDIDLLTSNRTSAMGGPSTLELHANDGSGLFTDISNQVAGPITPTWKVHVSDVDGDGNVDVLATPELPQAPHLLLGDGVGNFVPAPAGSFSVTGDVRSPHYVDLDLDGDIDVLSESSRFFENDGSGRFTERFYEGRGLTSFDIADLDGDRDPDILVRGNFLIVLANMREQLTYRTQPGIGKPFRFLLRSAPNALAFVCASTGRARIPLGTAGTLWLDPAGLLACIDLPLDALGAGSLSARIPSDPAVVGQTIYWQTFSVTGLTTRSLSNLEVTTFTPF